MPSYYWNDFNIFLGGDVMSEIHIGNLRFYRCDDDMCWYIEDEFGRYGYESYTDAREHFNAIKMELKNGN